jgi:hypothetical protein
MATYAEILNGEVIRVLKVDNSIIDENGNENETLGADFLRDLLGGEWVQTFYTPAGAPIDHPRGKFAAIGDVWDGTNFIKQERPEE